MNCEQKRQARSQFAKDDFAVIRRFLGRKEVDQFIRDIKRYVADVVPMLSPEAAFYEVKGGPSSLKQLPAHE